MDGATTTTRLTEPATSTKVVLLYELGNPVLLF
jgi:hypothetical protein